MLTWDLIEDCEGVPDGFYDDRLRGLRLTVENGHPLAYIDRDVLEQEQLAGNFPELWWEYPWGSFPDLTEFNSRWEMGV